MPAPAPLTFKEACRALDESLCSSRLRNRDVVAELVSQRCTRGPLSAEPPMNGAHPKPRSPPAWVEHAVEDTWQVLEVLRSSIGEWQTDAGAEHEAEVPLGQALQGDPGTVPLQPSLSMKLSHVISHGRPHSRKGSLLRHGSIGSQTSNESAPHFPAAAAPLPWNLQEQGKLHRVLYRAGPAGTPFHTMLLEGVVNSSVPTALAVCWEARHYPQWWPQFTMPTFKVTESYVAAEVNKYHNLTVTRLKVPWPFATRELGVSSRMAFLDPHTGTGLVILSTLPEDPRRCSEDSTGFGPELLPKVPHGVVRLGADGGYMFQRLGPDTCYIRAFVNVDTKLDVVPVWVINFINRTLAGAGFQVLSQVVNDAVAGKNGIGATFKTLLAAEGTLYREVERILSEPPPPVHPPSAPAEPIGAASRDGSAAGAQTRESAEAPETWPETRQKSELDAEPLIRHALPQNGLQQGAGAGLLPSIARRDPEIGDALSFLDDVIGQVKAETMSMCSEVAPARKGLGVTASPAPDIGKSNEEELQQRVSTPTSQGSTQGKNKRWWRRFPLRKMRAVPECF